MWNKEIKLPKFKFVRELQWWPLFAEKYHDKIRMSLGKCAFWIVLLPAMYTWTVDKKDIKPAHTEVLYALIAYNLAKKSQFFGGLKSPSIAAEVPANEQTVTKTDGGKTETVTTKTYGTRWKEATSKMDEDDQGAA